MNYNEKEIKGLENLCRFLCEHQAELHKIIMDTALEIKESSPVESDNLIMHVPIIQGSENQRELEDIGRQEIDTEKIRDGVDAMLKY